MDRNRNGFIEADELSELHQRRLNDPKSMSEWLAFKVNDPMFRLAVGEWQRG